MQYLKNNKRISFFLIMALFLIGLGSIYLSYYDEEITSFIIDTKKDPKIVEKTIVDSSGISVEEAIELIKSELLEDSYIFSTSVTIDNLYKVIATNTKDNKEDVYYVDPFDCKIYIDIDTK